MTEQDKPDHRVIGSLITDKNGHLHAVLDPALAHTEAVQAIQALRINAANSDWWYVQIMRHAEAREKLLEGAEGE
jgi:hypothetical protein